jgi:hypothetical protein
VKYLLYSVSSVICSYNGSFLYAGFLTDNLVIYCKHTRWSHNCSVVFVYADMKFHKYFYLFYYFLLQIMAEAKQIMESRTPSKVNTSTLHLTY